MRSRLSYYSVILLVGLAVVSALLFTMNPFNGAPASASPAAQTVATSSVAGGSGPSVASSPATPTPAGNGLQPGGSFDGVHDHHSDGNPGGDGAAGNGTATTTTTTGTIYSQDE